MIDELPAVDEQWLALTRFAAEYYQRGWGELAAAALPPFLRVPPGPRFAATVGRMRAHEFAPADKESLRVELTPAQRGAAQRIASITGFAAHLLFGVTGSGKTEVYLDAIERTLATHPGAQALVLVPEINLTPQLEARLRSRLSGVSLVTLHSGLAGTERSAAWLAAHEGRARLVLGTRTAVFASIPELKLIVVDEEHDASFKAGDGARHSARDLAVKRAQLAGIPIVLGSATPSLETWHRARTGRYQRCDLMQRAGAAATLRLPTVTCVDTRQHAPTQGLCAPLRDALMDTVARGEQALVFINRRGYAPVIACDACGWLSICRRCATFTAFHKVDATLRCHHCGWHTSVPAACPTCGNSAVVSVGHGTQRIEESLRELLPAARIARLDRDTTRGRHGARASLAAVHAGDVDVLVGTQMIAKGHDFRRVTLVGILNADAQLVAEDFRAPERLFAMLMQVAGRAGRSGAPSRVLVQTRFPDHPLYAALTRFDYTAFATQQLSERKAGAMPPYTFHALLTAQARTLNLALDFLRDARTVGRSVLTTGDVVLYDPVPMPLAKLAGVHRAQLLVESARRALLQSFLRDWLAKLRALPAGQLPRARWQIEIDPQQI